MRSFCQWLVALIVSVAIVEGVEVGAAESRPIDHALVPGFERFYEDIQSDAVGGGQFLLGELNCVACHKTDKVNAPFVNQKKAPHLDNVGTRLRVDFIRDFIANPHAAKPGTTMPNLFGDVPEREKQQQVEALVHFLSLTGGLSESAPGGQSIKNGEKLFERVGCVACHDSRKAGDMNLPTSIPLAHLSKKYSLPGLTAFIADPLSVRPSGRMPHLNLKPEEARDISGYLLKDIQLGENLKYSYYEGNWKKLPDFSQLKPKQTGKTLGFDLNFGRQNNFAVRFEGEVQIEKEGQYRFFLESDDGSRLIVDGTEIATNDGVHPRQEAIGRAFLGVGKHPIVVEFFQEGGGAELQLDIQGGTFKRQNIDSHLVMLKDPAKDAGKTPSVFSADPALAEKGKELFGRLGCASCHQLGKQAIKPSNEVFQPATLAKLKSQGGCLAEKPLAGLPQFTLNARQRNVLATAIDSLRKPPAEAPAGEELIDRTLTAFNCYACHQRGKIGGVEEARNPHFTSDQPEMGDEGRIPPPLTGVGAKLNGNWLKELFNNGAKDRGYMMTRMPKFGTANVGPLVAAFDKTDIEKPFQAPDVSDEPLNRIKGIGRKFVGAQGMSCIKCHTWGNIPATGIQSIGMTTMKKRLKESWFNQYLLDPQVFRPGTRMPQGWPSGLTFYPDVLGGNVPKQIYAVWLFLSDGDKAAIPLGLGRDPIELQAMAEPVIYRNFIEGSGARAIGVGYPEKVNLAFDANSPRLSLIWQHSFIDAARHWRDRGQGFQSPLGDGVVHLSNGPDLALLSTIDAPWPKAHPKEKSEGYQFKGYRLNDKLQPIFMYRCGTISVEDFPEPVAGQKETAFKRHLTLTSNSQVLNQLFFRAARGKKIVAIGQGFYQVDGDLRVRLQGGKTPIVRDADGARELIVPLELKSGTLDLVQELVW